MNEFMAKEVDFGEPPAGATGWSESTQCSMGGGKLTKTTKRTYNMADGSTQEKEIVESIEM